MFKQLFLVCFLFGIIFNVEATVYEVKMLNKGTDGQTMVFEPNFLKINAGDSVKFVPTDKSHSVESLKEGTPEGFKAWKGGMNKEITVLFDKEGVHLFKCLPHFSMGMIGAIQVGKALNLTQVKGLQLKGKAKSRFDQILTQVK